MAEILVKNIFPNIRCVTEVWASEYALEAIERECENPAAFMKKLLMLSQGGFANYEGEKNSLVRHERGEAYRVRPKSSSLFRWIGFYEDARKRVFVGLDGFVKDGNDYTSDQWKRIAAVSNVKVQGTWRREVSGGSTGTTNKGS